MPLQSLNIDLSNAAICKRAFSSAFIKKELPSSQSQYELRQEYSFLLFSKLGLYCFAGFYIP